MRKNPCRRCVGEEKKFWSSKTKRGVRSVVIETLRDMDYVVIFAGDARTALTHLRSDTDIALLLTDVGLPDGMNGRQLADEAQHLCPSLKVLFMTGYARNAIVHHGRVDPGVQLLTKPFTREALARKIREMLLRPAYERSGQT